MADHLETTMDAASTATDSNTASKALIGEVNNDRSASKLNDSKPQDQASANRIDAMFGSLTITGDDSRDTAPAGKTDTVSDKGGDASSKNTDALTVTPDAPAAKIDTVKDDGPSTRNTDALNVNVDAPAAKTDMVNATAADASTKNTDALTVNPDAPATTKSPLELATTSPTDKPATTAAPQDTGSESSAEKNSNGNNGDFTRDVAKGPAANDINADALKKIQDDPQVKAERKNLENDITKKEIGLDKGSDEYKRLETMRHNMEILEKRGASEHPPLGPEDIAKTYKSVSHLIEATQGARLLDKNDRVDLAEQIMLHAADPTTIDQGASNTCNVTTVEARMFTRNPSAAASVIEQVATTGEYHTPGIPSERVVINADSLTRHATDKEAASPIPLDGDRSYASQIFQVTAVNLSHQTHAVVLKDKDGKDVTYPKGTIEYRQVDPDEHGTPPNPSGEVLYDKRTNQPIEGPHNSQYQKPAMADDSIFDAYNMMSDRKETGFFLCNKDSVNGEGKNITKFESEAGLRKMIEDAQKNGQMPIILGVNSGEEPFYTDTKGGPGGGAGGGHVVTITGIDKEGNVMVDNQWGKLSKHGADRPVNIHELYIATMSPENAITQLKTDCAKNARAHSADPNKPIDYAKELELLRMRHSVGDLSGGGHEQQFKDELTWITRAAAKDAVDHKGSKLDLRTETELRNILAELQDDKDPAWAKLKSAIGGGAVNGIMDHGGIIQKNAEGAPATTPEELTDKAVESIHDAGDSFVFTQGDFNKMNASLAHKSPAELQAMEDSFQAKYHMSITEYIQDRYSRHPEERDKALKLVYEGEQKACMVD